MDVENIIAGLSEAGGNTQPIITPAPWTRPDTKTNLSYWFPIIEAAGVPVPRTQIMTMPEAAALDAWQIFDGGKPTGALEKFAMGLAACAQDYGAPFFLRTDLTSGKHHWEKSCFVAEPNALLSHILEIAYYSEMGRLPWNANWVVREMLPTVPLAVCPNFGDMPVCREFRFFVDGGDVECWHPYWPIEALIQGGCPNPEVVYDTLCATDDEAALKAIASKAGAALGGRWSVDLLETERGWFLTDMAEADKSFHWEGCGLAVRARLLEQGEG